MPREGYSGAESQYSEELIDSSLRHRPRMLRNRQPFTRSRSRPRSRSRFRSTSRSPSPARSRRRTFPVPPSPPLRPPPLRRHQPPPLHREGIDYDYPNLIYNPNENVYYYSPNHSPAFTTYPSRATHTRTGGLRDHSLSPFYDDTRTRDYPSDRPNYFSYSSHPYDYSPRDSYFRFSRSGSRSPNRTNYREEFRRDWSPGYWDPDFSRDRSPDRHWNYDELRGRSPETWSRSRNSYHSPVERRMPYRSRSPRHQPQPGAIYHRWSRRNSHSERDRERQSTRPPSRGRSGEGRLRPSAPPSPHSPYQYLEPDHYRSPPSRSPIPKVSPVPSPNHSPDQSQHESVGPDLTTPTRDEVAQPQDDDGWHSQLPLQTHSIDYQSQPISQSNDFTTHPGLQGDRGDSNQYHPEPQLNELPIDQPNGQPGGHSSEQLPKPNHVPSQVIKNSTTLDSTLKSTESNPTFSASVHSYLMESNLMNSLPQTETTSLPNHSPVPTNSVNTSRSLIPHQESYQIPLPFTTPHPSLPNHHPLGRPDWECFLKPNPFFPAVVRSSPIPSYQPGFQSELYQPQGFQRGEFHSELEPSIVPPAESNFTKFQFPDTRRNGCHPGITRYPLPHDQDGINLWSNPPPGTHFTAPSTSGANAYDPRATPVINFMKLEPRYPSEPPRVKPDYPIPSYPPPRSLDKPPFLLNYEVGLYPHPWSDQLDLEAKERQAELRRLHLSESQLHSQIARSKFKLALADLEIYRLELALSTPDLLDPPASPSYISPV